MSAVAAEPACARPVLYTRDRSRLARYASKISTMRLALSAQMVRERLVKRDLLLESAELASGAGQ